MRTITIGGGRGDLDDLFEYSQPYRYRLCGDGRVAVWMRDEEHDSRTLLFADAETGAATEHLDDVAPENGGSIEVCRGGNRVVHQDENDRVWRFRDRAGGKKWKESAEVPTVFDTDDSEEPDDYGYESVECLLAASADGATVVMVGTREPERRGRLRPITRAQVWRIAADGTAVPSAGPLADAELPVVVRAAASSGDRPLVALATAGTGTPFSVWDAATGGLVGELPVAGKRPDEVGLVFAPDGRRLAAGLGSRVLVWDADKWGDPVELSAGKGAVEDLAFSPDGSTLANAQGPGTVHFWDAAAGAVRQSFDLPRERSDRVVGVSFAPDGLTCLAGFASGKVVIWDV